ncbi:hypothetical protein M899_3198 [Bacteriovorax sp. BSW11_IV]|uniref:DUF1330 domain-containing protein n=1 Tax=Bacteriovorax sp. BSW11_IV TaxID=1353529 RepID=UPI00038A3C20|nr:DUF1330 domain-containing protein [Bacteriovorax sp. BSW11_IV]EQC48899.1 hypothetical protein M899_3198 [Bacteriovorax sp. BSW11_IV]
MIEMLVGLNVTNDEDYTNYRKEMTPILNSIGGGFGYDFKIAEVLKTESENKINRVFTIFFPSEEEMNNFFAGKKYIEIKEKYFAHSVAATTIMATYNRG